MLIRILHTFGEDMVWTERHSQAEWKKFREKIFPLNLLLSLSLLPLLLAYSPKTGLCDLNYVCKSVNPPRYILNHWTDIYVSWYTYRTRVHTNRVLHKSFPSVCVCMCIHPKVVGQRLGRNVTVETYTHEKLEIFLIPFYLQAVQIHSANGVKLLEAWRGVLSSTPPYK
jgi:hypothetical protein